MKVTVGENDGRHALEHPCDFREALDHLLPQGRRTLRILAPELDFELLSRDPVVSALAAMVRVSPMTDIRILLADSTAAVQRGHQLVPLARRFTTYIRMQLLDDPESSGPAWLVLDEQAVLWRPDYRSYTNGHVCGLDPAAGKLCREFDDMWERSHPDPELRRLHL